MITKILMSIFLILAGLAVFISTRPSEFRVERTALISAAPEKVFEQVNDLHKWEAWSPWTKMDPNMKTTYAGPQAGTGASQSWSGNNQVGEGSMTVVESLPNERIRMKLEFLKPFKAENSVEFNLKPQGAQTAVTWSMSGHNNFIAKAMSLFMNCEKMVGAQFEKGLTQLKTAVEKA